MWLLVCCLYKEIYLQIFKCAPFDYTAIAGNRKVGPVIRLTAQAGRL